MIGKLKAYSAYLQKKEKTVGHRNRLYRNLGVIPGYTAVNECMASDWHPRTNILTKQGHRQYRARQLSWQSTGMLIRRSLVRSPLQSILCSTPKIKDKFVPSFKQNCLITKFFFFFLLSPRGERWSQHQTGRTGVQFHRFQFR